jgi:nicotinamidase-related amidase
MVETAQKPNPAFRKASGPLASQDGEMAFVVDVQSFGMMNPDDAQAYADKLGAAIEDLRARNIPVTWLSMSDRNELIPPEITPPGISPRVRDLSGALAKEFYGGKQGYENAEIYRSFWAKHGPRANEAIYCKYFKSAFAVPKDADGNSAYRAILESETGSTFDKTQHMFQSRPTFTQYLENQGVKKPILMGAVSSHCVSETAASAITRGLDPTICSDLVLSWENADDTYDHNHPENSRLRWQKGAAKNSPLAYHLAKIKNKLNIIAVDQKDDRGISDAVADAIRNARLTTYDELAKSFPPRQPDETKPAVALSATGQPVPN